MNLLDRRRSLMQGVDDAPVFVDWIQNTGVEYIDVPFVAGRYSSVVVYARLYSDGVILGSGVGALNREVFLGYNGTNFLARLGNRNIDFAVSSSDLYNRTWDIRVSSNTGKSGCYSGLYYSSGTQYKSKGTGVPSAFTGVSPITIFGLTSVPSTAICKINKVKLAPDIASTDGVLDLRPCLYRGQYGLWDVNSDTFYGNASGQGAFTGGYND